MDRPFCRVRHCPGRDLFPLRPGVSLTSFFEMLKDSDQDGKITFEEFAKRYNINLLDDTERVNAYQAGVHGQSESRTSNL